MVKLGKASGTWADGFQKFRDLNVGDSFYFTSNFSYRCTKLSARTYKWRDAFGHTDLTSTVGTIDVEVRDVERGK